jgi:UDP-3-O-[3-hydroxymyristoyl] glucosamine N-acyltransferase
MRKKYKLTNEKIEHLGRTLYRIQAIIDFGNVKKGEKGGFIEKEENLSHQDNAWVSGNAKVYDNAWVFGNARVYGNVQVYDNAKISGNALVCGNTRVCGDARINKLIRLVGGYFYNTKKKSRKIEIVETCEEDEYETLAYEPEIEKLDD